MAALVLPFPAPDVPEVVAARADGARVHVTLAHPDTGRDHHADGREVVAEDGTAPGLRVLTHPHVGEQPLTCSLTLDAPIPDGPAHIRARCSLDGWRSALAPVRRD